MRIWLAILGGLLVTGCHKKEQEAIKERAVSYSREIRPILAAHCVQCHASAGNATGYDLSLRNPKIPTTFITPHPVGSLMTPEEDGLLLKWRVQGAKIDRHWSLGPLATSSEWGLGQAPPPPGTSFPEGDYRKQLREIIAGDLLPEASAALKTAELRRGDDSPQGRLGLISRLVGFPLNQTSELEGVTKKDLERMTHIFTTPYDALPPNPLRPPTMIVGDLGGTPVPVEEKSLPEEEFAAWLAEKDSVPQMPDLVAALSFNDGTASNLALGHFQAAPFQLAKTVEGISGLAVAAPQGVVLPEKITFSSIQPFTLSLWLKVATIEGKISLMGQGEGGRGFYLGLQDGKPVARLSRYWPGNAIGITSEFAPLLPERWTHLVLRYDGSRKAAGLQLLVNGIALDRVVEEDSLLGRVFSLEETLPVSLGGMAGGELALDEIHFFERSLSMLEMATLQDGKALLATFHEPEAGSPELGEYYLSAVDEECRADKLELLKSRAARLAAVDALEEIPVMESLPRAEAPSEPRTSGPRCLDAVDRLGFVDLLLGEDQYLLARALANSVSKIHFGEALVPDLGYGGMDLKNAAQLDFLAERLIEFDWDLAKLSNYLSPPTSP